MSFLKKYFQNLIRFIIHSINQHKTVNSISNSEFLILLHLIQPLSYFVIIYRTENISYSFYTLAHLSAYSNLIEFLSFLENSIVSQIVYFTSFILLVCPYLLISLLFFYAQLFNEEKMEKSNLWKNLIIWLKSFLYHHYWIFILPINDLFFTVFISKKEKDLYLYDDENNVPVYLYIISLIGMSLNMMTGLFTLLSYRSVHFLDNDVLNINFSTFEIVKFLVRALFPLLFYLYMKLEILFYIHLQFWMIILFYDLKLNFPFRNTKICQFYTSCLFMTELIILNYFISRYSNLLDDDSLFYTGFIMSIFGFKLGGKIFQKFYENLMFDKIVFNDRTIYFLEEVFYFYENIIFHKNTCVLYGLLRNHTKKCKDEYCLYFKKDIIDKNILKNKVPYLVNRLILRKFSKLIPLFNKNNQKQHYFIIKFISYLTISDLNPVKCLFEFQKIVAKTKLENTSIFNKILLKIFREIIKGKIKKLSSSHRSHSEYSVSKNQVSTQTFLKIVKAESFYDKKLKDLIVEKKKFWDNYEKGFSSMEDLINISMKFSQKLNDFSNLLLKNKKDALKSSFYLLNLKYLSIVHTVFFNTINTGLEYEDEFESFVLKAESHQQEQILNILTFLDPDTVTCLISFLNNQGIIKNDCKNERIANFFGYPFSEFKSFQNLSFLMPPKISHHHDGFIDNFLRKSKKKLQKSVPIIETFALNKKGFIFPIKTFYGYNFDYQEDFVIMAALMKLNDNRILKWLCDHSGNSLGITENLFTLLFTKFEFLKIADIKHLNLIYLAPKLEILLDEAKSKLDDRKRTFLSTNHTIILILPKQLKTMLELLKSIGHKQTDDDNLNLENQSNYSKTWKTIRSNKNEKTESKKSFHSSIKISQKNIFNFSLKNAFENLSTKHELRKKIYEIHTSDLSDTYKFVMNFNIIYKRYKYGPEGFNSIDIFWLDIIKIEPDKNSETSLLNTSKEGIEESFQGLNEIFPSENPIKFKEIFGKSLMEKEKDQVEIQENVLLSPKKIFISKNPICNEVIHTPPPPPPIKKNKKKSENNNLTKRSSSVIGVSKNYLIFSSIEKIKILVPKMLVYFRFSFFLEIILVFLYCVILFIMYSNYIPHNYEPIQSSLINLSQMSLSISYTTSMYTEYEFYSLSFNRNVSDLKKNLFMKIMNENYELIRNINFQERNKEVQFDYVSLYRTLKSKIVDFNNLELKYLYYADILDIFSDVLIERSLVFDANSIQMSDQIIFQRNYPYFFLATNQIFTEIEKNFSNLDAGTTLVIMAVMITFLLVSLVLKFIQAINLVKFNKQITSLVNIFRRVTLKEAFDEKNFSNEILNTLQKPYLRISFYEKSTTKIKLEMQHDSNVSKSESNRVKKSTKRTKMRSLSDIKQLSKAKIIIFVIIILIWSIFYYFFNYYFWIINKNQIDNLIQINVFLFKVYKYSSQILVLNTLSLREKIIANPDYESINDIYQNHDERLIFFNTNYDEILKNLNELTSFYFLKYTMEAKKEMNNKEFEELLYNNSCVLLIRRGIIGNEELDLCSNSYGESMKRGVLSLFQSFIEKIRIYDEYTKILNDEVEIESQKEDIKKIVSNEEYEDFLYSYYYYHHTLLIFFDFINLYYKDTIDGKMNNLFIFVITSSILTCVVLLVIAIVFCRKMVMYYQQLALILSIIPQEKIINDDQTKFLINNYLKNN